MSYDTFHRATFVYADVLGEAGLARYRALAEAEWAKVRALDWAQRGWRAFSGARRDERLRAFLADAYQSRGRRDEAMALI